MHRRFGKSDIVRIAVDAMQFNGLEPDFSSQVEKQIASITGPAHESGSDILAWPVDAKLEDEDPLF